jgi:hypothetical protein
MAKTNLLLVSLFMAALCSQELAAQATRSAPAGSDTAQVDEGGSSENPMDWAWRGDFRPFFEANYGLGTPKHKAFANDFSQVGLAEFKIGLGEIKQVKDYIYSIDDRYLYASYISKDIDYDYEDVGAEVTKATRFGSGNRTGYGYRAGEIDFLPYAFLSLAWTRIDPGSTVGLSAQEIELLERYDGPFRFGQASEAGVKLGLFKTISLTGGYEYAVIFPRHLFAKWLGSFTIQSIGYSAISLYGERIVDSSPVLGPILYFLLQNGVTYAFYWQMRDNMNWPFETETPLTFESLKLGASITF